MCVLKLSINVVYCGLRCRRITYLFGIFLCFVLYEKSVVFLAVCLCWWCCCVFLEWVFTFIPVRVSGCVCVHDSYLVCLCVCACVFWKRRQHTRPIVISSIHLHISWTLCQNNNSAYFCVCVLLSFMTAAQTQRSHSHTSFIC